jgi:hypothetical protein
MGDAPLYFNCVEKLRLIAARGADSLVLGAGDPVDDGRMAHNGVERSAHDPT